MGTQQQRGVELVSTCQESQNIETVEVVAEDFRHIVGELAVSGGSRNITWVRHPARRQAGTIRTETVRNWMKPSDGSGRLGMS